MENKPFIYTDEQLMARLKFFIGICLALTLTGIVFVVLYSLIFVTQPLNAISPIDQKFFELIVPIATFLTGTLSGIMLAGHSKEDKEAMLAASKQATESFKSTMEEVKTPAKQDQTLPSRSFNTFNTPMHNPMPSYGAFGVNTGANTAFAESPFGGPVATTASGKKIVPDVEQPLL